MWRFSRKLAGMVSMRSSQAPWLGSRLRRTLALLRAGLLVEEPSAIMHLGVSAHQHGAAIHARHSASALGDQTHRVSAHEEQCSAGFASPALCGGPENDSAHPAASDSSLSNAWPSSRSAASRHRSLQGGCSGGGGGDGSACSGAWQARSLPLAGERRVSPPAIVAAAAMTLAVDPAEAAEGFGPVVGAMRLIDGLHSATGLPWWATFAAAAAGAAAALLAFSVLPNCLWAGPEIAQPSPEAAMHFPGHHPLEWHWATGLERVKRASDVPRHASAPVPLRPPPLLGEADHARG